MKRITILLVVCLCVLTLMGCVRNTNSTKGSVIGALINTPLGQVAFGGIEFHTLYTDLANEELTIHDVNYYDASASLGADSEAGITQAISRDYKVNLKPMPVEDAE